MRYQLANSRAGTFASTVVVLVVLAFVLSYFAKALQFSFVGKEPPPEYASLPEHASSVPLASRIAQSSGLALVFVISEYSQKNAAALEALRNWARDHFQKEPRFLDVSYTVNQVNLPQGLFGSFVKNLIDTPKNFLEDKTFNFVREQIAAFHKTGAYAQLKDDFYDSFGRDKQSALLLASYEYERAQQSVPVLLGALFWLIVVISGIYRVNKVHSHRRDKAQKSLSGFWIFLACFYLVESWVQNSVPLMLSSLVSGVFGIYLRRPITASRGDDKGLSFRLLTLGAKTLGLLWFFTFSLVTIQILTWIKLGTLVNPDPISLLIFGLTGNYFHDPILVKRILVRLIGILWLFAVFFTIRLLMAEHEPDMEGQSDLTC